MAYPRQIAVVAVCLALSACTNSFFQPAEHHVLDPKSIGLIYENIDFEAADGTLLHVGSFRPKGSAPAACSFFMATPGISVPISPTSLGSLKMVLTFSSSTTVATAARPAAPISEGYISMSRRPSIS